MSFRAQTAHEDRSGTLYPVFLQRRPAFWTGGLLVSALAVLVSLIPKPENDLFFILRTGDDILRTHRVPHADTYSWTNYGTRWDVPEWGTFVLYAEAFHLARFLGTWALMAVLTVAAALIVYEWVARHTGAGVAFGLTSLCLLALSPFVQERPYAWTYLLFPIALIALTHARQGQGRLLLWLPPLCALWANLHQGVLAFVALVIAYATGDFLSRQKTRAVQMFGLALGCAGAVCVSPYGWGIYRNAFVTLRDPNLMANVTEWRPVYAMPGSEMAPFVALVMLTVAVFALSSRKTASEILPILVLLGEAVQHARSTALFAVGSLVIIGPYLGALAQRLRLQQGVWTRHRVLLTGFAALYTVVLVAASAVNLSHAAGPQGLSPEGIGEAVARAPRYPENACAFMAREKFPPGLHLLNSFENGGFLLWRMPMQRVFIDGRLDIYAGRTFDDNLVLAGPDNTFARTALLKKYDPDCVLTTRSRVARLFASDPQWEQVYADSDGLHSQHAHIFLRRVPQFAGLIARCRLAK